MRIVDPLTTPSEIEGHEPQKRPWQAQRETLDLLPHGAKRVVASRTVGLSGLSGPEPPVSGNENGASTARPQRESSKRTPILGEPVVVPSISQGRRSLRALMHWEGVVEHVNEEEFYARLTPFEDGVPNPARVEFTEFSLDDLANPDDRDLVEEGARFYWTIGRATNVAGTLTNVSLVRFRRLLANSAHRRQLAEAEADALLKYGS